VTRQCDLSARGASILVEEAGGTAGGDDHSAILRYLAVTPGSDRIDGTRVEAGRVAVSPDRSHRVPFERSYDDPYVLAELQGDGSDDASTVRLRDLTADGVDICVETDRESIDDSGGTTDGSGDPVEDADDLTGGPEDTAVVVGYLVAARD
jgi:hypothetical protein